MCPYKPPEPADSPYSGEKAYPEPHELETLPDSELYAIRDRMRLSGTPESWGVRYEILRILLRRLSG